MKKKIKTDKKYLENVAIFYLQKYASSKEGVKRVLLRRIEKAKKLGANIDTAEKDIAEVLQKLVSIGYLDDKKYACNKALSLIQKGKSLKFIEATLKQKGVGSDEINAAISFVNNETDGKAKWVAAIACAKRKKLGPFAKEDERKNRIKKDLAAMARAGFDYDTSQKIIFAKDIEELNYLGE